MSATDEYIVNNLFKTPYQVKVTHPLSDDVIDESESPLYDLTIDESDFGIKDEIMEKMMKLKILC